MRESAHVLALERFIAEESVGRTSATARRYQRVLVRLLQMLDTLDVASYLGTGPAGLLEVERDFGREGAFFRLFGYDELVCCLPALLEPPWLPQAAGERRTQISIVDRLLRRLRQDHVLDMAVVACAVWEAHAAVRRARDAVWVDIPPDRESSPESAGPRLRLLRGGIDGEP